jgi:hypothetical protein
MMAHRIRELRFAKINLIGGLLLEEHSLLLIVRAHDGFDLRVQRTGGLDHLPYIECVGRGDDQQGGFGDMSLDQHRGIRSIAGDGGKPFSSEPFDQLTVFLGDDIRDTVIRQHLPDPPSHTAIANQNHLAG